MTDLSILIDGELMVAQAEGVSDDGTEFIDGYFPKDGTEFSVVDSGRILLPQAALPDLREAARERGLQVEESQA